MPPKVKNVNSVRGAYKTGLKKYLKSEIVKSNFTVEKINTIFCIS